MAFAMSSLGPSSAITETLGVWITTGFLTKFNVVCTKSNKNKKAVVVRYGQLAYIQWKLLSFGLTKQNIRWFDNLNNLNK